MKFKIIFSWVLQILAAIILLQTLYFKFTGHPESVALFTKLGVEPWGRILTGILELIASILLLIPATIVFGAVMGLGLMLGALISHIAIIGIESQGDGGQLFLLALLVLTSCIFILFIHKQQLMAIKNRLAEKLKM
jgi:uncharacterized membrane protein YphA (DoxX/SURF4 family)